MQFRYGAKALLKLFMTSDHFLNMWLIAFDAAGILGGIVTGFFKARKIQLNGFKWSIFRWEVVLMEMGIEWDRIENLKTKGAIA